MLAEGSKLGAPIAALCFGEDAPCLVYDVFAIGRPYLVLVRLKIYTFRDCATARRIKCADG